MSARLRGRRGMRGAATVAAAALVAPLVPLAALAALATPVVAAAEGAAGDAAPQGASGYVVRGPQGPVPLGDRFELVVSGDLVGSPELDLGQVPAALRAETPRLEATPDGVRLVQPMRAVREGEVRLDGLALVEGEARHPLPPVDVRVTLDLPAGRIPRVAEPLAPVAVPSPPAATWPFALAAGAGLLLLGALVVAAGRRVVVPPPPPRPPELVATEALAALRLHLPATEAQVPAFVDAVSDVLRTYVEDRFGARAPESTTEEFLAEVLRRGDALSGHADALRRFLTACDLVKFARHRPPPAGVVPLLDTAEGFVEDTRA